MPVSHFGPDGEPLVQNWDGDKAPVLTVGVILMALLPIICLVVPGLAYDIIPISVVAISPVLALVLSWRAGKGCAAACRAACPAVAR